MRKGFYSIFFSLEGGGKGALGGSFLLDSLFLVGFLAEWRVYLLLSWLGLDLLIELDVLFLCG